MDANKRRIVTDPDNLLLEEDFSERTVVRFQFSNGNCIDFTFDNHAETVRAQGSGKQMPALMVIPEAANVIRIGFAPR